jgi:hypothetical protein
MNQIKKKKDPKTPAGMIFGIDLGTDHKNMSRQPGRKP